MKVVIKTKLDKIQEDRYGSILREFFNGTTIENLSYYKHGKAEREQGIEGWQDMSDNDIKNIIIDFIKFYITIRFERWHTSMYPRYNIKGKIFNDGSIKITHGHHRISILKYIGRKVVRIHWEIVDSEKVPYEVLNWLKF